MTKTPPHYQSFILRIWQERELPERSQKDETAVSWRFSLENTETSQRLGFNQLDDLCNFFRRQTNNPNSDAALPDQ